MAPMWIAKETGLFKPHGADVGLAYIDSPPMGATSILAGEAEIGIIECARRMRRMENEQGKYRRRICASCNLPANG
jgi:hypothetical protein